MRTRWVGATGTSIAADVPSPNVGRRRPPTMRSMGVLAPSLTPADYVDPDVYARECESVLAGSWLPLCRVDQLAEPGAHVAMSLIGRPLVAVRDGEDIRVLANVCRTAARASSTTVPVTPSARVPVSPLGVTDSTARSSARRSPRAPTSTASASSTLRHVVWKGFVLVNPSGDAPDPLRRAGRARRAPRRGGGTSSSPSLPGPSSPSGTGR